MGRGRLLGIDYGEKRIGLALSDETQTLAFPHCVIPNTASAITAIAQAARREGVSGIVIGESKDYQQRDNPVMASARRFGEALARELSVPVSFEPEYLSSEEARLHTGRVRVDAEAAAIILQSYIDRQKPRADDKTTS